MRELLTQLETTRTALLNLVNAVYYVRRNKRVTAAMREAEQALASNRKIIARTKRRLPCG